MKVENAQVEAFYSTIFVAVLALFGLLVAALIYVSQTVQARYSVRLAQRLLKGRFSVLFWCVGFLTVLASALALFDTAFPLATYLPGLPHALTELPKSVCYGVATLGGVFLTLVMFLITLRSYAELIAPIGVLRELARDLTPQAVRDIALLRLHEERPESHVDFAAIPAIADFLDAIEGGNVPAPASSSTSPIVSTESLWQSARKRLSILLNSKPRRKQSEIARIKARLAADEKKGKLEDPLSDLFEYALLAIRENNAHAWREVLSRLVSVFKSAIKEGLLKEDSTVPFLADQLLLEGLRRFVDEVAITKRFSLLLQLAESMKELCLEFAAAGLWPRVYGFLDLFQSIGDAAILRKDQPAFRRAMKALVDIGITSLQDEPESDVFDDACRKVGWLGERLILRGIDDAPIMPSGSETRELGEIRDAIGRLTEAVRRNQTEKYPIILKDAIEVITNQMLARNEPEKFRETAVILLCDHCDLAKHLISQKSKNAELYLWITLNYLKEVLGHDLQEYGELKRDVFYWVASLASEAIQHNQALHEIGGYYVAGPRDLLGMIIHFMTEMGEPSDWDGQMTEVLVKSTGHHDESWRFIKRAGMALQRNFGLMFDAETGEDYALDDPRRH